MLIVYKYKQFVVFLRIQEFHKTKRFLIVIIMTNTHVYTILLSKSPESSFSFLLHYFLVV